METSVNIGRSDLYPFTNYKATGITNLVEVYPGVLSGRIQSCGSKFWVTYVCREPLFGR